MAKKRITLEQAEGLMSLGTIRKAGETEANIPPAPARQKKKPEEVQVSAYIHRDLHRAVKIALAEEGTNFTALITDFLKEWVKNR
jgi:hypothetical protein